ncbi:MAG TPA: sn-glycerol-3-phosphate ABC transporter ATP-binding protein UgpC [Gemmatimonadaceae bacterium]|nr:sn-glycerol-3-phosphate ABC transporter ATP-binding protein UgpC [Gemmatimonadaceae bacterium]
MTTVRLESVRKEYGADVVVDDVSFEAQEGEFLVLVGPSGCGKSTTLRMIAGLETITAGQLRIGDAVVNDVAPSARDIAMVFQSYALYPHMTVRENMAFALVLRRLPRPEIDARVRDTAAMLGLDAVLDRTPRQLSGGQRQRVAIGRAIVRQPRVFLFDEPLSNLDAKMRVQMRREISALQRRLGVTTIYVTHDQVEAMTMGDRIVVMHKGRIQQIDTPLGLYDRPRTLFVAGFIGSPAMNTFAVRVDAAAAGAVSLVAEDGALTLAVPGARGERLRALAGRRLVLGIRPESLYLEGSPRPARPMVPLRLTLAAVEPLGNEALLYATAGAREITARVAPQPLPRAGDAVDLLVDVERVHLFDADTEERVETRD